MPRCFFLYVDYMIILGSRITIRDELKTNTPYSVTLSLKVGGGKDEIIVLGAAKIVTLNDVTLVFVFF